jgi:hypothetical protein
MALQQELAQKASDSEALRDKLAEENAALKKKL